MWRAESIETFRALDGVETEAEAFALLVEYARVNGADLVSYHHYAPPMSLAGGKSELNLMSSGFPEDWLNAYRNSSAHRVDPITSYISYQTRPVLWSDVGNHIELSVRQEDFLASLFDWLSPGDGLAIPLFGPSGRHGYVGMGSTKSLEPWDAGHVRIVQSVCESFHLRFCELRLRGLPKDFELTERESQILKLMASGHADWILGGLIGTSPDGVRTAIEGILKKMCVSDRASAILRAQGLGLLERG